MRENGLTLNGTFVPGVHDRGVLQSQKESVSITKVRGSSERNGRTCEVRGEMFGRGRVESLAGQ